MTHALLLDANLPPSLTRQLAATGVTSVHVGQLGLGNATDELIIEHARARREVLVTHDLDFSRILAVTGAAAPSVIVLRLRLPTPVALANAITAAFEGALVRCVPKAKREPITRAFTSCTTIP